MTKQRNQKMKTTMTITAKSIMMTEMRRKTTTTITAATELKIRVTNKMRYHLSRQLGS